jgi:HK97 family phage prohead protease
VGNACRPPGASSPRRSTSAVVIRTVADHAGREIRSAPLAAPAEVARSGKPDSWTIRGLASATEKRYTLIEGLLDETIARGAFTRVLAEQADPIFFNWNHDPSLAMASTRATPPNLDVSEQRDGLRFWTRPTDTQTSRDVVNLVRDGVLTGASFAFRVAADEWEYDDDGIAHRRITEVSHLFDVCAATVGASPFANTESLSRYVRTHAGSRASNVALSKARARAKRLRFEAGK